MKAPERPVRHIAAILALAFSVSIAGAETFSISYENGSVIRRFPEGSRPVIGLALSGGGARGLAHIGVIEILEGAGIPIDRVAGTSMGSIVGGLYAAGYTADVIESFFADDPMSGLLSSNPKRRNVYIGQKDVTGWPLFDIRFEGFKARVFPASISTGQNFNAMLSWFTLGATYNCGGDFDRLSVPFRAVATNCISGHSTVLGKGNLARAIQASSTVPGVFAPVEWEDSLLIDGGLTDNLPVGVVRNMGSDFVIAVAIEESMHSREELDNPLNMADQVTSIPMRNITAMSRASADFVINPDMTGFSSGDFSDVPGIVDRGRRAAADSLAALRERIALATERFRKAPVSGISILPAEEESFVREIFHNTPDSVTLVPFAAICEDIETLWNSGRYFAVEATLDDSSGILCVRVIPVPRQVVIRTGDGTESFSSGDGNERFMGTLMARMDDHIRHIRSEESASTFASISFQRLDETGDTLFVTVSVPKLTGIFTDESLRTRKSVIFREMEMKPGDVFDLRRVMETVGNLYGTNLFEHVSADVFPYEGGVGCRLNITERDWTVVRLGLKYDDFNGTEGKAEFSRENILGYGNQVNATLQLGSRTRMLTAENRVDRIYSSLYTFNLRAYAHQRFRPVYEGESLAHDYTDERYGLILSIGQVMDKLGNAVLQFRTETAKTDYPAILGKKDTRHEFRSLIVRSLIDSYDRYPFPRSGILNTVYLENASSVLGGTERFVKIYWGMNGYRTFGRRHTVSGSLALGSTDPATPEIEWFSLGGAPSRLGCTNSAAAASLFFADFAGLRQEQKSGTKLAAAKLSYRLFIPRYFYLDFSVGAGNVWDKDDTITRESLLQCYGITGSFDTYLGPISSGWGITSHGEDCVYFSAGREF